MTSTPLLPCVELEPTRRPAKSSVIWLHGLGADGNDFVPIIPLLGLDELGVRFVFPHAPRRPVTINMGMVMPAWYDITELGARHGYERDDVLESAAAVTGILARERERGVPSERTILAGFSQGGVIALHVALRHPEPLAGIVALSTYLIEAERLDDEASPANREIPIFAAHGDRDPLVPVAAGDASRRELERRGHPLDWHTYPMGHEVHPGEIRDLGLWLRARLTPSTDDR